MTWVTIYDVRNGWTFWVAGAGAIATTGFALWMLILFVQRWELLRDLKEGRRNIAGAIILFSMLTALIAVSSVAFFSQNHLRDELNSGDVMKIEGIIESAHIERGCRSNPMYFRVAEDWFKVPYSQPRDCFPHLGEQVRIEFEPSANIFHRGPPAHRVLKMQLTHGCRIAVWG